MIRAYLGLEGFSDGGFFDLPPWEVDPEQPRIDASWFSRFRHYNNLDKCEDRLKNLLSDFQFGTTWEVLNSLGFVL